MREPVTAEKLRVFLQRLGELARGPGIVYLVGGATAVSEGWRQSTIDVDLKLDPEPAGVFEALRALKEELAINIELASPDQFIPELSGWRERSRWVGQFGPIEVRHYDDAAQALAKLERGHVQDLSDVDAMEKRGLISRADVLRQFALIEPFIVRYPRIDAAGFAAKVQRWAQRATPGEAS